MQKYDHWVTQAVVDQICCRLIELISVDQDETYIRESNQEMMAQQLGMVDNSGVEEVSAKNC